MDRAEELRKQIAQYEALSEQRKWKRTVKTFIGLSIAFYVLGLWLGLMEGVKDYLLGIVAAPFCAGFYMFVNVLIFLPINSKAMDEAVTMARLETELRMIEKGQE